MMHSNESLQAQHLEQSMTDVVSALGRVYGGRMSLDPAHSTILSYSSAHVYTYAQVMFSECHSNKMLVNVCR